MTKEEAEEYAKGMSYRQAVYNALQGKCIPYRKATLIKLYELLDMVDESLPSVQPTRKQGFWIYMPPSDSKEIAICSLCGKHKNQYDDNFCAFCGADMRGEQNYADSN